LRWSPVSGKGGHDVPGLLHEVYDNPQPGAGTEPPSEVPPPSRAGVALAGLHVGRHHRMEAHDVRPGEIVEDDEPPLRIVSAPVES